MFERPLLEKARIRRSSTIFPPFFYIFRDMPGAGLSVWVMEISEPALHAIQSQVHRIRIGDEVFQDSALPRNVDANVEQVLFAVPAIVNAGAPRPIVRLHRHHSGWRGIDGVIEQLKTQGLCRRRPHAN
jgi:hypothetical protein